MSFTAQFQRRAPDMVVVVVRMVRGCYLHSGMYSETAKEAHGRCDV